MTTGRTLLEQKYFILSVHSTRQASGEARSGNRASLLVGQVALHPADEPPVGAEQHLNIRFFKKKLRRFSSWDKEKVSPDNFELERRFFSLTLRRSSVSEQILFRSFVPKPFELEKSFESEKKKFRQFHRLRFID